MMPPRLPVHIADIQHVRQHGQRIPFADRTVGKRPAKPASGQTGANFGIVVNEQAVVVGDPLEAEGLPVDCCDAKQQTANDARDENSLTT